MGLGQPARSLSHLLPVSPPSPLAASLRPAGFFLTGAAQHVASPAACRPLRLLYISICTQRFLSPHSDAYIASSASGRTSQSWRSDPNLNTGIVLSKFLGAVRGTHFKLLRTFQ